MSDITCCMNIETKGVSEWSLAFSRIWRVGNVYYGCGVNGVYMLGGPDDDEVPIECCVKSAHNGLESNALKRVPYARVDGAGQCSIALSLDEVMGAPVLMESVSKRAKFARGIRGRHIAFSVTSDDPAFYLYEIEANVEELKRGYQ